MNKKKIIIMILVVLVAIVAFNFIVRGSNKGVKVSVIGVVESNIVKTIDISGSVYANDSQEISIPVGVKVNEVYFEEDDVVNKGDVLAVLDSKDLNLKLEKAQISLAQLEADIKILVLKLEV